MTINFHTPTERRSALAITFSLALQAVSMGVAGQQPDERIMVPLDQAMPDTLVRHATEVELIPSGPQQGLQVRFGAPKLR